MSTRKLSAEDLGDEIARIDAQLSEFDGAEEAHADALARHRRMVSRASELEAHAARVRSEARSLQLGEIEATNVRVGQRRALLEQRSAISARLEKLTAPVVAQA